MKIEKNYNLSKLNTFGIQAKAKLFVEINTEEDIKELFILPEFQKNNKLFLGGGSNVLFTKDFDGIVILNKLKGIEIIEETSENVKVRALGGENWHDMVTFAVDRDLWGIENLSLIPGTVGAAPMQNIGAYGVELKNTLLDVEAYNIETGEKRIFPKEECELGYRESIFKHKNKGQYFIFAITLRLNKKENRNISYRILADYLEKNKIEVKRVKDISDAVAAIRRSKLPDPKIIGNAGSFFKNIFVSEVEFKKLQTEYPDIPHFEEPADAEALAGRDEVVIKIPAGWFIEKCGPANGISWKGYRIGNVGVHERQALVLVNYGGATGREIVDLASQIISSVKEKFNLELTPEVNIV
ncbi:MAG: UDP-N-acetylmuramate dehydrogenase [Candidatus Paceibacterota bacterium]